MVRSGSGVGSRTRNDFIGWCMSMSGSPVRFLWLGGGEGMDINGWRISCLRWRSPCLRDSINSVKSESSGILTRGGRRARRWRNVTGVLGPMIWIVDGDAGNMGDRPTSGRARRRGGESGSTGSIGLMDSVGEDSNTGNIGDGGEYSGMGEKQGLLAEWSTWRMKRPAQKLELVDFKEGFSDV